MTTECTSGSLSFQAAFGRDCVARFDAGRMSSDAGVLLLAETDRLTGILSGFADCFHDCRDKKRTEHSVLQLVRQRVLAIALGYEDLNDHDELRKDPLLAVVSGSPDPEGKNRSRARDFGKPLAGKSTLNRIELSEFRTADTERYKRIAVLGPLVDHFMVETFLNSHDRARREIVLDMDSTDDPVHGEQEGRYFQGYYDHYCYLPLYIFSGRDVLLSKLLPGNADPRKEVLPELMRIVRQIRNRWPGVRIIIRGDSGFMSDDIMSYCETSGVDYVLGMPKNARLVKLTERSMRKAQRRSRKTGRKAREFQDLSYRTRRSWSRRRRVVAKAEYMDEGSNPRFVVTSISRKEGCAQWLYEDLYCQRGEMENRIKEQQLDMFSDRTSTHSLSGNQLRLYFSAVAYMLMAALRRLGLRGTEMARAQCGTIRTRLLKIGAIVRVTVRKIWISMPESCPYADLFRRAHGALLRC